MMPRKCMMTGDGGLRHRYCVIVGRYSKMEMVVLLNGAVVSYNPLTIRCKLHGDMGDAPF